MIILLSGIIILLSSVSILLISTNIMLSGMILMLSSMNIMCMFAPAAVEFLGHLVDQHGVRPLQRHVQAISDFPP